MAVKRRPLRTKILLHLGLVPFLLFALFPFYHMGLTSLKTDGELYNPASVPLLIREGVTMNPGTAGGGLETVIGDRCAFLANSHVGHDCRVGSHVVFSNNVMLAGHCSVGDYAILGGGAAVIQFARVGAHAFVGGLSGLENDCIPYGMVLGNRAYLSGLNIVGLQRRGFAREDIHTLRRAYRLLFAPEGTLMERVEDVANTFESNTAVREILEFIRAGGKRSICTPREAPTAVGAA